MISLKPTDKIFDSVYAILLFFLPLSFAIPNIVLGVLFLLFIGKKKTLGFRNPVFIIISSLVLFLITKALLNGVFIANLYLYKHQLALVLIVLITLEINNKKLIYNSFIAGVFVSVLLSIGTILRHYYQFGYVTLGNNTMVGELLTIHRPYLGMMCFLSMVLIMEQLKDTTPRLSMIGRALMVFFVAFIFFIAARLALGLSIIFFLYHIVSNLKGAKWKKSWIILLTGTGIVVMMFSAKTILKRFHIQETFDETVAVFSNQEPRVVIWSCAIDVSKEANFNHFTGYADPSIISKDLVTCFKNVITNVTKKEYYVRTAFNTHNQFLGLWLQGGVVALCLFMLFFLYPFFKATNSNMYFVIVGLLLFNILENSLERQVGVYLLGIFIPLVIKNFPRQNAEKKNIINGLAR